MLLKDLLHVQGGWLFKYRSYVPIVILVCALLSVNQFEAFMENPQFESIWSQFCLWVGLFGLLIRCVTVGYSAAGTSGRNRAGQAAESLNTSGIYSMVRNPLYLGNFFMWLAPALISKSAWVLILFLAGFVLIYERIILAEEEFLVSKFGKKYTDWATKTPVFFPKFSLWKRPEAGFQLKKVLTEEYRAFSALIFAIVFIKMFSNLILYGRFILLDEFWNIMFLVALVCLIVGTAFVWGARLMLRQVRS